MHRLLNTLVVLCLFASTLSAQVDLDAQLLRQTPNCESVAYNSTLLINELFQRSQVDSINQVITRWSNFCGESEPLFRAKVLTKITLATFDEASLTSTDEMSMVLSYLDRQQLSQEENYHQVYEYYKYYLGYVGLNSEFDLVTVAWATSLLDENSDLKPTEKAYCLLYSNQADAFWAYLQTPEMQNTELAASAKKQEQEVRGMWDGHINFFSGVFVPNSNLYDVIGVKPIIGFQLGAKVKKTQYDFTISYRPGKAKEYYEVQFQGYPVQTRDHAGGYIGIDFARELTNNYKRELDLEWGIGADIMDVISGDPEVSDDSKTLASFNFNCGLGYRFYFKNMNYIGLHAKYNFINYNNKQGTSLSGDYLSFTVSYNLFGNASKYRLLEKMQLK